ncbi:hypothetical protein HMPREF9089_01461 [Eubacterium brachy ATCC 33089]|nr:hypothetical protein HMPREF9089_01461 [Eubacterium brachy ATCC 33089]
MPEGRCHRLKRRGKVNLQGNFDFKLLEVRGEVYGKFFKAP